jgi:hypothetical protein
MPLLTLNNRGKNNMTANYQGMTTEKLIDEFILSELRVPIPLVKEICNRPDSVPYLARIIEEDIYWEIGGPGDAWSSIHALHLLGVIKTIEALHVLIAALRDHGEDIGDWLLGSMPSILANFGPYAIEPLKAVVLDEGLDGLVRGAASKALVVIAYNHSECREPIIKLFRQIIRDADVRDAEDSDMFISLLVEDLAQFKDQAAIEEIELAFTKGLVDESYIDLVDVKRIYRMPDEDMQYHHFDWDPIDHFSQENIECLGKGHYEGVEKQKKSGSKLMKGKKKKKIGRNDPCPCGSGKKYKKCCLRKESL